MTHRRTKKMSEFCCAFFFLITDYLLVPWHGFKIHHLQMRNAKCSTLNWFIISPTRGKSQLTKSRLFLLAPQLPEAVSGILQRLSEVERCVPTFPNAMEVFPKIGAPQNGWFIMENPIKMDDLGVPLFSETSKWVMSSEEWICSAPMWNPLQVTEVKRSHWPQLSPDCYGLRVGEVSRQRYVTKR